MLYETVVALKRHIRRNESTHRAMIMLRQRNRFLEKNLGAKTSPQNPDTRPLVELHETCGTGIEMRGRNSQGLYTPTHPIWWAQFRLTARVIWALLKAQVLVWHTPTGELVGPSHSPTRHGEATIFPYGVAQITRKLFAAANRLPIRPQCLVRAVALGRLLASTGHTEAVVCAGVRIVSGRFEGHAWVEYNGQPLGEDPTAIATFAPMASVHVRSFS